MPVLEDFKPDIIINSAGQDNHFSDPITNMNFSAQGYADLTEMLKPDIAVLEGGYSIEGALPYVNLGIILAMAGIDYSGVKEPGYDPESIRQTPQVTQLIEKTGELVLSLWKQRETEREKVIKSKDFDETRRNVFYDTDGINESQKEKIRICKNCSGTYKIDSTSDRGFHIMAIHIPRKACKECKGLGYKWYDIATKAGFDIVFLQDRTEDKYLSNAL